MLQLTLAVIPIVAMLGRGSWPADLSDDVRACLRGASPVWLDGAGQIFGVNNDQGSQDEWLFRADLGTGVCTKNPLNRSHGVHEIVGRGEGARAAVALVADHKVVLRWQKGRWRPEVSLPSSSLPRSALLAGDGSLWLIYPKGVFELQPDASAWEKHPHPEGVRPWAFHEDREAKLWLFATSRSKNHYFRKEGADWRASDPPASVHYPRGWLSPASGRYWTAHQSEIFAFESESDEPAIRRELPFEVHDVDGGLLTGRDLVVAVGDGELALLYDDEVHLTKIFGDPLTVQVDLNYQLAVLRQHRYEPILLSDEFDIDPSGGTVSRRPPTSPSATATRPLWVRLAGGFSTGTETAGAFEVTGGLAVVYRDDLPGLSLTPRLGYLFQPGQNGDLHLASLGSAVGYAWKAKAAVEGHGYFLIGRGPTGSTPAGFRYGVTGSLLWQFLTLEISHRVLWFDGAAENDLLILFGIELTGLGFLGLGVL